ncbi:MAG TPA: efflux RND transporter permease subunit, partial [Myxococcaceae bacterium]|nr:efflux RND transporter permease subunit [Myxococcaceae bacterium]
MNAASLALRHSRGILFLAVSMSVAGLIATFSLPKGVYPELTFPREEVVANLAGAPATTVIAGITRPLEEALASVPGVQTVRSRTIRGAVAISLFFAPSTDMAQAHSLVLARVAEVRSALPPNTELRAARVLPSGFPILSINVEAPYPPEQLYALAQYTIRPALSGLPGIGLVSVQSSDIPEVQVLFDPGRLQAAHLTLVQIADRL